jgi:hypothetical protein
MTLKFLIDECLSPELVDLARSQGHVASTCLRDQGKLGLKDWQVIRFAVENDYTLVTNNSVDFRGAGHGNPGGEHARLSIHAGLVCLNSARSMDIDRQRDLFQLVLDELATYTDLINQA